MENKCFSVISLGLIMIRGRGLPKTSPEIRHAFLLSIVILLPHLHMFRLYFTAFSTSETCKLLLPQHQKRREGGARLPPNVLQDHFSNSSNSGVKIAGGGGKADELGNYSV